MVRRSKLLVFLLTILFLLTFLPLVMPSVSAENPKIHVHDANNLVFVFYFEGSGVGEYQVVVDGNDGHGVSEPTIIAIGHKVNKVEVYDRDSYFNNFIESYLIETILPKDIYHPPRSGLLKVDGSTEFSESGVLDKNSGDINFWYYAGSRLAVWRPLAKKVAIGEGASLEDVIFTFAIYEVKNGSETVVSTGTSDADGKITLKPSTIEHTCSNNDEHVHSYKIKETGPYIQSWNNDNSEYNVAVTMKRVGKNNGFLSAVPDYIDGPAIFTNEFFDTPLIGNPPPPTSFTFTAIKKVHGATLKGGDFEFELYTNNGRIEGENYDVYIKRSEPIQTVANEADGKIIFKDIAYDYYYEKEGTVITGFEGFLVEKTGNLDGWTYDTNLHYVFSSYAYYDSDFGNEVLEYEGYIRLIPDDSLEGYSVLGGVLVNQIVFVNVYSPNVTLPGGNPTMDDDDSIISWSLLSVVSVVAIGYVLVSRRGRRDEI